MPSALIDATCRSRPRRGTRAISSSVMRIWSRRDMEAERRPGRSRVPRSEALPFPAVAKNPDPTLELSTSQGVTRTLDDWSTMFHLCLVILPDRPEAAAGSPSPVGSSTSSATATARTAYVVTGTAPIAERILGDDDERRGDFIDPDRTLVGSLGLEHLPAFVFLRQDTTVGAAAEGWDPAEWQQVAREVARPWPGRSPTSLPPEKPFRPRPPAGPPKTAGQRVRTLPQPRARAQLCRQKWHLGPRSLRVNGTARSFLCSCARPFCGQRCQDRVLADRVQERPTAAPPSQRESPLEPPGQDLGSCILSSWPRGLVPAAIAQGSPLQDKQAQAQRIEAQIQANGRRS